MRCKTLATTTVAALALLGAVAAPSPAEAQTCVSGTQATCEELVDCYLTGALMLLTASPDDAAAYYRRCLSVDKRYRLHVHRSGEHAHRRSRALRTTRSTFWPLYCEARREAGHRHDRLCRNLGRSAGSGATSGAEPRFTG